MNADFSGSKGINQFRRPLRTKYLLHLCYVARGYAGEIGYLFPAIEPPIFRQF